MLILISDYKKKIFILLITSLLIFNFTVTDVYAEKERSVLAISSVGATAILTLATYAGLQFHDSSTFDEFLRRMIGLQQGVEFVGAVKELTEQTIDGTVKYGKELVSAFKLLANKVVVSKNVKYEVVGDHYMPIINSTAYNDDYFRAIISQMPLESYRYNWLDSKTSPIEYKVNDNFSFYISHSSSTTFITCHNSSASTASACNYAKNSSGEEYGMESYPFIYDNGLARKPGVIYNSVKYDSSTGEITSLDTSAVNCRQSIHSMGEEATPIDKSLNMTVGDAWSTDVPSNDDSTGGVSLKLPSDMSSLINKTPSDVASPSYNVWTPGTDISVPAIDNPAFEYIPEDTTDVPDVDIPSDTPTDKPSEGSSLLERIISLIQSIIDWLTSFWDKLLDFIINLFVPSDSYWVDKFKSIESALTEKVPSLDISILEDMASGEVVFEDIYATFFGQRCLVVRASLINNVIGWARPILQGVIALFLLLYNYNQVYHLLRSHNLVSAGRGEE